MKLTLAEMERFVREDEVLRELFMIEQNARGLNYPGKIKGKKAGHWAKSNATKYAAARIYRDYEEWHTCEESPPEPEDKYKSTVLELKDTQGRVGYGYATWYDWTMKNGKVIYCDWFWDGGFLVQSGPDLLSPIGDIKYWRLSREHAREMLDIEL